MQRETNPCAGQFLPLMKKLLPFLLVALVAAGCKHGPSLVGKWTASGPSGAGGVTLTFTQDGKFNQVGGGNGMAATTDGTYTESPDSVTFTVTSIKVDNPAFQKMLDQQVHLPIKQSGSLKWNSDDSVAMTITAAMAPKGAPPQTISLSRVKA